MASCPYSFLPSDTDTVIIGNGPSALILSYILHGHLPYYDLDNPHPDPILHAKLKNSSNLLRADLYYLTEHFSSSSLYSDQAMPMNTLLDTLLRPNADTTGDIRSRLRWVYQPHKAIPHLVLGNANRPGGQWVDPPGAAGCNIGALSYAEMLSLPGYTYADHYRHITGEQLADFTRPTRTQVAGYFASYPEAVGIRDSIHVSIHVKGISRSSNGFKISSPSLACKYLVLASGIFSDYVPPPALLRPITCLQSMDITDPLPILVIGSGFSAADVILSTSPYQKVVHLFRWPPDNRPSPLRACHPSAYPEYAGMYRRMKLAALQSGINGVPSPVVTRESNAFDNDRGREMLYEGFSNAEIIDVRSEPNDGKHVSVTIRLADRTIIRRSITHLAYMTGRQGSLNFLAGDLLKEVMGVAGTAHKAISTDKSSISAKTMRSKAENSLEVAPDVFIIGSLTGDSLVRFAYGGCVFAASKILRDAQGNKVPSEPMGVSL
ncbi:MAG: hypothetical protein M1827_006714 [Pycnora praestabilis]|nr:MAG: hypothetical protein M1827_006714 [Pycnora praestabilis]